MNLLGRGRNDEPATDATTDDQALRRYRYMVATAPPEDIERAHEEAFARLTPEQRRDALQALAQHVPESELSGDDPAALARTATRAEMRLPGTLERSWWFGPGLGSWFITTLAASFIGTGIAQSFFDSDGGGGETGQADSDAGGNGGDTGDAGSDDGGGDMGGGDIGGGDFGDFGGF
ncbi:MAG: hypothetical protein ABIQ58_02945 [Candidatus Limnocylindrales bacterium]